MYIYIYIYVYIYIHIHILFIYLYKHVDIIYIHIYIIPYHITSLWEVPWPSHFWHGTGKRTPWWTWTRPGFGFSASENGRVLGCFEAFKPIEMRGFIKQLISMSGGSDENSEDVPPINGNGWEHHFINHDMEGFDPEMGQYDGLLFWERRLFSCSMLKNWPTLAGYLRKEHHFPSQHVTASHCANSFELTGQWHVVNPC